MISCILLNLCIIWLCYTTLQGSAAIKIEADDASCPFEVNMCGWINNKHNSVFYLVTNIPSVKIPPEGTCEEMSEAANEVKGGGGYAHSIRDQKMRYWKHACGKRCYYIVQQTVGVAEIDSPTFTLKNSTIALQVNFSYWLQNINNTAQLRLLSIDSSGPLQGVPIQIWETDKDQTSTDNWNLTSLIIKNFPSRTLKLVFLGNISSCDSHHVNCSVGDLIAIDRIDIVELDSDDFTSRGIIPDISFIMEPQGNSFICPRNTAISKSAMPLLTVIMTTVSLICRFHFC